MQATLPVPPAAHQGVGLIHAALESQDPLWSALFASIPFGWNIRVWIEEYLPQSWQVPVHGASAGVGAGIAAVAAAAAARDAAWMAQQQSGQQQPGQQQPGQGIATGVTAPDPELPGEYDPAERKITIFKANLAAFRDLLLPLMPGGAKPDSEHMYAWCLVKLLFLARTDFHVDLVETEARIAQAPPADRPSVELDTLAEYFALRFVRDVLQDTALFYALCVYLNQRRQTDPNDLRAAALDIFGPVDGAASPTRFQNACDAWCGLVCQL